jgi:hypothetical protein
VGGESEVAVCENGKWWSKCVQNLKWLCVKMEGVINVCEKQQVVGAESGVAMHENGKWWWRGAGLSQEASVVQEAGNDNVIG